MRNRIIRLKAAAVVLVLLASAPAQSEPRHEELPNFHQVNAQLYRGAQPRRGGIQRLTQFGVKTIINLRDDDERASAEEREARAAGLRYFNVSMAGHAKPTDEQVERVLSIINAPENQPVFVHCKRGADRTGTIIAAYRISHDKWTSGRAKEEANRYGMRWTQFEMKDYITDYYRRRIGLGERGDLRTDITSDAATVTRRALEESYSFTHRRLRRLRRDIP